MSGVLQNHHAWNPSAYAASSCAQLGWAQELMGELRLEGREEILDIGCGDGKVTARLAQHVPEGRVVGIDSSRAMIDYARRQYPNAVHRNLEFLVMDAVSLTFGETFDIAFSNATLHWVRDQVSVLKGVARALKKGGTVVFEMGGWGNAREYLASVDTVTGSARWKSYFVGFRFPYSFFGPQEYERFLGEAGLRPTSVYLLHREMVQNGREGLAGWMRTTWLPYLERLPAEEREEFIMQVVDAYAAGHPPDAEGTLRVAMVRLHVRALKP